MNPNGRSPNLEECRCIIDAPTATNTLSRLASSVDTQWTRLSPETVIVATANSAWLYKSDPMKGLDRFAQSMDGTSGSLTSTQNLLDGAIAAAYYRHFERTVPELTLEHWIWKLAGHYHLTNLTPILIEDLVETFVLSNRLNLVQWARRKVERERYYNQTTVQDIEYLGYDAQAVIAEVRPRQIDTIIDYLIEGQKSNPLHCIGYSYVMEHIATRVERDYIGLVESLLPPNIASCSRPWLYGSAGIDIEDVRETIETVAGLTAKERTCVARACYDVALLCFNASEPEEISNLEIQPMLKSF